MWLSVFLPQVALTFELKIVPPVTPDVGNLSELRLNIVWFSIFDLIAWDKQMDSVLRPPRGGLRTILKYQPIVISLT